jgi:hypothetical protein
MPRESVFGSEKPYGPNSSAQDIIEVTWSREAEHVQVATKLFNDDGKSFGMNGDEMETPEHERVRREIAAAGFYCTLDRSGINALIRNLRRARDQAFGRDE